MIADNVFLRARRAFLPFKGVLGVGWGPKWTRGRLATNASVIVFVERKLPPSEIRRGEHVPDTFEGYPTDVRVPQLVPERGAENRCLNGDVQWIDWAKIHQMWQEQHPTEGPR